jgi:CheY-like chemotaxis protein
MILGTVGDAAFRVLVVEDDREQREIVEAYLARPGFSFQMTIVDRLDAALAAAHPFDAILLDLNLPDSHGLETLDRMRAHTPAPIVVLTGLVDGIDTGLTRQVLSRGAADYIPKDTHAGKVLARTLFHAIERNRLMHEVTLATEEAARLRESSQLTGVGRPQLTVTAELIGDRSLRQEAPEAFADAVKAFGGVVNQAIESQRYSTTKHDPREGLFGLADLLGRQRATARDVIELYRESIAGAGNAGWREEARLVLIALLGHVLSFYRMRAVPDGGAKKR